MCLENDAHAKMNPTGPKNFTVTFFYLFFYNGLNEDNIQMNLDRTKFNVNIFVVGRYFSLLLVVAVSMTWYNKDQEIFDLIIVYGHIIVSYYIL